MATDYLQRMYWPKRGLEAVGENRTTYGQTIAMSAKLAAANKRAMTRLDYDDRNEAFLKMVGRKSSRPTSQGLVVSAGASLDNTPESDGFSGSRSRTFMAARNNHLASTPLDIALYNGPTNDPFVPKNSYREYVLRRNSKSSTALPNVCIVDEAADMARPVHRLFRTGGGYDDTVKASYHIKSYQPQLADISEYSVRQGRNGGGWRHVKEVMQGKGQRIMFVDGIVSIDDLSRIRTKLHQSQADHSAQQAPKRFTTYRSRGPSSVQSLHSPDWQVLQS